MSETVQDEDSTPTYIYLEAGRKKRTAQAQKAADESQAFRLGRRSLVGSVTPAFCRRGLSLRTSIGASRHGRTPGPFVVAWPRRRGLPLHHLIVSDSISI